MSKILIVRNLQTSEVVAAFRSAVKADACLDSQDGPKDFDGTKVNLFGIDEVILDEEEPELPISAPAWIEVMFAATVRIGLSRAFSPGEGFGPDHGVGRVWRSVVADLTTLFGLGLREVRLECSRVLDDCERPIPGTGFSVAKSAWHGPQVPKKDSGRT